MHAFTICHYEPLLYVVGFFRSHWLHLKSLSTQTVVPLVRGPWRSREGAGGERQPGSPARGLGVHPPCAPAWPVPGGTVRTEKPRAKKGTREEHLVMEVSSGRDVKTKHHHLSPLRYYFAAKAEVSRA